MKSTLQTRLRELWYNLQKKNKLLCKEWLDFENFKKDILTIEGSDLYKEGKKCYLKLREGNEYNKVNCYFKYVEAKYLQDSYVPTELELKYLYKCINNEIGKYPKFYSYRDELKSIGNFALGKACCTYNGEIEFKYYALKCIQNEIRTHIINNTSKVQSTISADNNYTNDEGETASMLDIINSEDTFKLVDTELILEDALNSLSDIDKLIIQLSIEGYYHREIGDKVGLSESYVGRKIKKITTQLEEIMYN